MDCVRLHMVILVPQQLRSGRAFSTHSFQPTTICQLDEEDAEAASEWQDHMTKNWVPESSHGGKLLKTRVTCTEHELEVNFHMLSC